ncbi:splicing factor YJU2-like isoform X2 [Dioscorea cayenensis subsp. rotundata]|uniref:Splicing factor YJU2 n=1 Tax=Dioscorea cayennensis subsp. rotundata TaxID=55577 RepID=A0AB40ARA2_DIOCR|nr:splicing factor YJU2-like isoform X2 [Dioscorea cayenensis subsp. rotundata]
MGERKVLNKYYPPDFDPAKIPRRRQPKNQQIKVRMMLPMSIRCSTCGTYIYKGTKFNSRKEDVIGETYLGIQIFRFYFKCTKCSAEITFKTDPQNSDYVVESGAARNFEPWRDEDEATDTAKRKREEEEMGDAMKSLENRAMDSKQDMDILAALEEMKSMKSRHATVSIDLMLQALQKPVNEKEEEITEEDEALIRSIYQESSQGGYLRRIDDDDDDVKDSHQPSNIAGDSSNSDTKIKHASEILACVGNPTDTLAKTSIFNASKRGVGASSPLKPKFMLKPKTVSSDARKKPRTEPPENNKPKDANKNDAKEGDTPTGLLSLCQNYDSDESE